MNPDFIVIDSNGRPVDAFIWSGIDEPTIGSNLVLNGQLYRVVGDGVITPVRDR